MPMNPSDLMALLASGAAQPPAVEPRLEAIQVAMRCACKPRST
jgi:hypothetical protein